MAHLVEREPLLRANSAMILTLVGGGLLICALGAVIFDIGRSSGRLVAGVAGEGLRTSTL